MPAPVLSRGKYAALFAAESRDQLARAARAAAALRAGSVASPGATAPSETDADPETAAAAVDEAFRAVHTVKGMAAAMGYAASESAAHEAEQALAVLRGAAGPPATRACDGVVRLIDALERAVECDTAAPAQGGPLPAGGARAIGQTGASRAATAHAPEPRPVRVDAPRLDALLDLAGDLSAARGRLAAAAARSTDPALARAVHDVARLAHAVHGAVLEARLVPLSELFERLPRLVREAAHAAGREVAFEAAGGDLAVDRAVLDALAEPLTHLLRNAVDHGIEPPTARVAAGKPAVGLVRVAAEREPGAVSITVDDDGAGVDRAAVLAAAARRGLVPGAAAVGGDEAALLELLARPGLTTAAAVSRVSGRGVGVDAALARVRALGGSLALRTAAGRGTRFTLRVPLTLAVTPVLHVRVAGAPYALPLAHVRGVGQPVPDERPVSLAALLGRPPGSTAADEGTTEVVVLDAPGGGRLAVAVDRVDGQGACVVKPLPRLRGAFRTATAATILDGGEVALVIDVPALAARLPAPAPP